MMYPRWLARFLAWVGGYFWLPCPVCGENFAGFESGRYGVFKDGSGWVACRKPECQQVAVLDQQLRFRTTLADQDAA